jgi:hypothetical protein
MAIAHFFPFFGHSSNGGIWRRRRVLVVFGRRTVHVPANSKTDKTRHHQPGSSYHHPMRIFHLGEHFISPSPSALGRFFADQSQRRRAKLHAALEHAADQRL